MSGRSARRAPRSRAVIISGGFGKDCRRPARSRSLTAPGTAGSSSSGSKAWPNQKTGGAPMTRSTPSKKCSSMTASGSSNYSCTSPTRSNCGGFTSGSPRRPSIGRSLPRTSATGHAGATTSQPSTTCSRRPRRRRHPGTVPAEYKWFARLAVAKTAVKALGKGLALGPPPLAPEVVEAAAVSLDHEERAALGLVEPKQAKD